MLLKVQAALWLNTMDTFIESFADHLKLVVATDYSAYKTVQVLDLSDASKTCSGLTDFPIAGE